MISRENPGYRIVDEDDLELPHSSDNADNFRNSNSNSTELSVSNSKDTCGQLADRILFSTAYFVAYIFIILSNFVLIIWLLVMLAKQSIETRDHWAFITLDVIVNIAFVSEISLLIISQKKAYFSKYTNLFDFAIMALSVFSLAFYMTNHGMEYQLEDLLALGLMGIRYLLQFLRLVAMIRRHRKLQSTRKGVDFSQLRAEDFHFIHSDQESKL
jgi:hypothetical protein